MVISSCSSVFVYSCSATAELSIVTDETELRRIHKRNCKFANGNDSRNKSIRKWNAISSDAFTIKTAVSYKRQFMERAKWDFLFTIASK